MLEAELEFIYLRKKKYRGRSVTSKVVEITIFLCLLVGENASGRCWQCSISTKILQLQLKGESYYYFDLAANLGFFKKLSLIPMCKIK